MTNFKLYQLNAKTLEEQVNLHTFIGVVYKGECYRVSLVEHGIGGYMVSYAEESFCVNTFQDVKDIIQLIHNANLGL